MEFAHAAPSVFRLNLARRFPSPFPVTQYALSDAALQRLLENRAKFVRFVQKHVNSPSDAAASGISENNAAVRVHRARQALRKQVQLTCGACATHGCVDCRCQSGVSAH